MVNREIAPDPRACACGKGDIVMCPRCFAMVKRHVEPLEKERDMLGREADRLRRDYGNAQDRFFAQEARSSALKSEVDELRDRLGQHKMCDVEIKKLTSAVFEGCNALERTRNEVAHYSDVIVPGLQREITRGDEKVGRVLRIADDLEKVEHRGTPGVPHRVMAGELRAAVSDRPYRDQDFLDNVGKILDSFKEHPMGVEDMDARDLIASIRREIQKYEEKE